MTEQAEQFIKSDTKDKSWRVRRVKYNDLELAFAEEWAKESKPRSWYNFGHGMAQDLFIVTDEGWPHRPIRFLTKLTKRDHMMIATVVQWLGTNVGMSFLRTALNKCGYDIVRKKDS